MIPRDPPGKFDEPWQAQAFALTLQLHDAGAFTWTQWTAALARSLAEAAGRGESVDGSRYYEHWLGALEALVTELGLLDGVSLTLRKAEWTDAYLSTPHGFPVSLPVA